MANGSGVMTGSYNRIMALADLSGRTVLITGASSGIGQETARALAHAGATLITVSRASGSGAEIAEGLKLETGCEIHHFGADFSSLAEVRRVANEVKTRFSRLDVLLNNAGAFFSQRQTTADGFEKTFALNHLAYFLLTHLLLGPLLESPSARVINVASQAERFGQLHFGDLMLEKGYGSWKAYGQSKLANLLFSYELARRLAATRVSVNALHPGGVASGFGGGSSGAGGFILKLARPFFKTSAEGAQTPIYLATSPEVEGVSGRYYIDRKPASSSRRSRDREVQARLWRASEQLVSLDQSEAAPLRGVREAR